MPSPTGRKWLLIVVGTIIWSLTMVKSGLQYTYGLGFWGPNGHDGIWHLALVNSLAHGSLTMPIFAPMPIHNYHLGFDLLLAGLTVLTRIPAAFLYFQLVPPILALLTGLTVYQLLVNWTNSHSSAWWATFFTYFGGSWGWIVSLLRGQGFGGESMFWSQQSISTLLNPPFALSLVVLFLALIYWHKNSILKTSILFGLLGFIKVYAGILALGALFVTAIYEYTTSKKTSTFKIFLLSTFLFLLFFLPFNQSAGKLIVFQPFWFLETLMGLSDRFNWPQFYSAMLTYKSGHNLLKFPIFYSIALIIFFAGNMGTRVVGLFHLKKSPLHIFSLSILFFGILIPMLFLQTGTPWNTIQFFYYSQIFLGLLAGIAISKFTRLLFYAFILIMLTVPTTIDTLWHVYLPNRPPAKISSEELEALTFLHSQPPGTVITYPIQPDAAQPAPRPLYYYESTAYVAAYSAHPVFLEDEVNLNITGYDWRKRHQQSVDFFASSSPQSASQFLQSNHVEYIYLPLVSTYRPLLSASQLGAQSIFENSQVAIWQVPAPPPPAP